MHTSTIKELFILLVAIAILACTSRESEDDTPADQPDTTFQTTPDDMSGDAYDNRIMEIVEVGYSMGGTVEEIRANFGEPDDIIRNETTNRHTGETDHIIRMKYPGLEFQIYRVSHGGKELLMKTILTDQQISQRLPFRIGASMNEIKDYLGEPTQTATPNQNTEILQYETPGPGASNYLLLHFAGIGFRRLNGIIMWIKLIREFST